MTPERFKYLKAVLARETKNWNPAVSPIYHVPVYPRFVDTDYDLEADFSRPAEVKKITFEMKRGVVTHGDILRPRPGRWIEAEGYILEAYVYEDGEWRPYPPLEGERA